jgi:glycosyltransferase involved in cell wall biosynthesis
LFLRFGISSVWIALREDYDVAFASSTPLTAAIPGIAARWLRRRPFVFEVRDLWPELPRAMGVIKNPIVLGAISGLEWLAYRSAHRLIGLAPGIVGGIARRGIPRDRIAFIPNGCDLDLFVHPGAPWRPPAVEPGDLMAVFAGAHGMANGLDAVLDAAATLRSRGRTDIKLVLVGDGILKPRLTERARREGLTNVVFQQPITKPLLAGLMRSTDVGLQSLANVPAFYDGTSPNKFFDYLSAGRPVLINYPGWLAEEVQNAECGFAVPPDDAEAFAAALIRAADNRSELAAMGKRARALAATRFNRTELSDRFVDWLEGAAQGRNPSIPAAPSTPPPRAAEPYRPSGP